MNYSKRVKGNLMLLLTALIWGFAFVAQRVGMEHIGPFTFNGLRFGLGAISILPLIFYFRNDEVVSGWKNEIKYGLLVGVILFCGASLQQFGLLTTTASNAAFITGLYIIFVPIIGLSIGNKVKGLTWIATLVGLLGLYLLSVKEGFNIFFGDFLEVLGAVFWSVHILVINHYSKKVSTLKLAFVQFVVCSILSMIISATIEEININGIKDAFAAIIYGGFCSVGIAYTLQVMGQKNSEPIHAALILSLESLFGAIGGYLILNEILGTREIIGCSLMLIGTILAQVPSSKESK